MTYSYGIQMQTIDLLATDCRNVLDWLVIKQYDLAAMESWSGVPPIWASETGLVAKGRDHESCIFPILTMTYSCPMQTCTDLQWILLGHQHSQTITDPCQ